jgi:ElaB/YqjD/DUF883 family membrane-anchored ribosome-binding protein
MPRQKEVVAKGVNETLNKAGRKASDALREIVKVNGPRGFDDGLDQTESMFRKLRTTVSRTACSAANTLQTRMGEHPFTVFGSALALGLVAGALCWRHAASLRWVK